MTTTHGPVDYRWPEAYVPMPAHDRIQRDADGRTASLPRDAVSETGARALVPDVAWADLRARRCIFVDTPR